MFRDEPLDPDYATPRERDLTRRLFPLTYDEFDDGYDDRGDQMYDCMRDYEFDRALDALDRGE